MSAAAWIIPIWSALSFGLLVWMTARWRQVARDVKRVAPAPAWLDELFKRRQKFHRSAPQRAFAGDGPSHVPGGLWIVPTGDFAAAITG